MASSSHVTPPRSPAEPTDNQTIELCPEATLDLLEDKYAQSILSALREEPRSARCLHKSLDASRATVYRRLDALEDAGLVEGRLSYDPSGNHRQVFYPTVSTVEVSLTAKGIEMTAVPSDHLEERNIGLVTS